MWYKLAAYGTIDLNKYISESLGENFDVEAEISNLITSSINNKNLDFKLLNENLSKSPLNKLINEFLPSYAIGRKAQINFNTKQVFLSVRSPIKELIQSLKHELRHATDKGRSYRPDWISRNTIDKAVNYFNKFKNKLLDQSGNFVYDIDRMIFEMIFFDFMSSDENFRNLSDEEQINKTADYASKIKRTDLLMNIFESLANGEKSNVIQDKYYMNDPGEYVTHLSDIKDLFSPEALSNFAQQNSIDDEVFINMMKDAISTLNKNSDLSIFYYISSDGANLLESILKHAKNPQMVRNVYKILSDNFQKYVSEYAYSNYQIKEAKKKYNSPRAGKMKKRWSVKYKKSIDCNNPKGFSQKQYCKRKKSGGEYKKSNTVFNFHKYASDDFDLENDPLGISDIQPSGNMKDDPHVKMLRDMVMSGRITEEQFWIALEKYKPGTFQNMLENVGRASEHDIDKIQGNVSAQGVRVDPKERDILSKFYELSNDVFVDFIDSLQANFASSLRSLARQNRLPEMFNDINDHRAGNLLMELHEPSTKEEYLTREYLELRAHGISLNDAVAMGSAGDYENINEVLNAFVEKMIPSITSQASRITGLRYQEDDVARKLSGLTMNDMNERIENGLAELYYIYKS